MSSKQNNKLDVELTPLTHTHTHGNGKGNGKGTASTEAQQTRQKARKNMSRRPPHRVLRDINGRPVGGPQERKSLISRLFGKGGNKSHKHNIHKHNSRNKSRNKIRGNKSRNKSRGNKHNKSRRN